MEKLTLLLLLATIGLASAKFPFYGTKPYIHKPLEDLGEPLLLTPFIKSSQLEEVREAAEVDPDKFLGVRSYSGYFTVDEPNNGNLFFWFFPSASNYEEDPVLLWLQGGPGASSLYGLFTENGPFVVEDGELGLRNYSWHKNFSLLYIDQPLGVGYSFTDGPLVTDQTQVGEHLYSALTQFFTVFSELRDNEFFISGESYAGKYVPALGHTILQNNDRADLKINLQGLLIGNGLSDPKNQFNYGDLLYQLGLIDLATLEEAHILESTIKEFIEEEDYESATFTWNNMLETLFYQPTGLMDIYNFVQDEDNSPSDWEEFIVQNEIRQALHVGNQEYLSENYEVYDALYADITKSVTNWVIELLDNYRVLLYNGQLDIIVGYVLTENYVQNLQYSAAEEYAAAQRKVWRVGDQIAGYAKTAGNLTEVLVRNAGHMVPMDQPEFAYDLLMKFTKNKPIAGQ